jgi:hypothetical protein
LESKKNGRGNLKTRRLGSGIEEQKRRAGGTERRRR